MKFGDSRLGILPGIENCFWYDIFGVINIIHFRNSRLQSKEAPFHIRLVLLVEKPLFAVGIPGR